MAHRVTLIPGDGTGPEITAATRAVLADIPGFDSDFFLSIDNLCGNCNKFQKNLFF